MDNEKNDKFPTFQWIAGILITIVLLISSAGLSENRNNVKDLRKENVEIRKENVEICNRVTAIETANKLQFEEIKAWRQDVKLGIKEISDKLDKHERGIQARRAERKLQENVNLFN
jgi:hypothetical protein